MALSDVAKQELKTHMDIELCRNRLSSAAQMELETHMNIELSRNLLTPAAQMELETHMNIELRGSYSIDYKILNKNFINLFFY